MPTIEYLSTRGDTRRYAFTEAVLTGIAPDGGLFVPTRLPVLSDEIMQSLVKAPYWERAIKVLQLFETDIEPPLLKRFVRKAYSSNFETHEIAPLVHLKDNQYILELWHGPTSAFKDMALQIMPLFFEEAMKRDNQKREASGKQPLTYLILIATSGDTGSAGLEGFKDLNGTSILVFFPNDGVSHIQGYFMRTTEGNNVEVTGMDGDFDAAQQSVKDTFNDYGFTQLLLEKYHVVLSSANSINWGRLLPQIVYHISGYLDLIDSGAIQLGDEIDIAVPSGNFGNILAAFYTKKMGLPVGKLICASNANNILSEFLRTGVYDIRDKHHVVKTPSPSMDIIVSGNVERLLFELTKDAKRVSLWMRQLWENKIFSVDAETLAKFKILFFADWVSNDDCLTGIKGVFGDTRYLMDPHTSVAQTVATRYTQKFGKNTPIVICSTANFAKFPGDVYRALTGTANTDGDEFAVLNQIWELVPGAIIPAGIKDLQAKKIRHSGNCEVGKEAVERVIFQFLGH